MKRSHLTYTVLSSFAAAVNLSAHSLGYFMCEILDGHHPTMVQIIVFISLEVSSLIGPSAEELWLVIVLENTQQSKSLDVILKYALQFLAFTLVYVLYLSNRCFCFRKSFWDFKIRIQGTTAANLLADESLIQNSSVTSLDVQGRTRATLTNSNKSMP